MTHLGYNTNGFAHHRLEDVFEILREIGYTSVAVTLERDVLDPPNAGGVDRAVAKLRALRELHPLRIIIETGSRFILDPHRKHQPTLVSAHLGERRRRLGFLEAAVDIAAAVSADSVSLWSGAADDDASDKDLLNRLADGMARLLARAESRNVRIGFEPEPGMFIDTMERFARLHEIVNHRLLGLTLDVGHVHCLDDGDMGEHIRRWRDKLWNIHIEDMRRGRHEHLMFGDGEMDFAPIFDSLRENDFAGSVNVELSRHSHDAVEAARRSFGFLKQFLVGTAHNCGAHPGPPRRAGLKPAARECPAPSSCRSVRAGLKPAAPR